MEKFTLAKGIATLASNNVDYRWLVERNAFDVGIYRPDQIDNQTPHQRDELYIIASGSGRFVCGEETEKFSPGDVFFVPAGFAHRFENFSEDLAAWVVFFGERPSLRENSN